MTPAEAAKRAVHEHLAVQREDELAAFGQYLLDRHEERPIAKVLEIGSDKGGTLYFWRQLFPDAEIVSVSLRAGEFSSPGFAAPKLFGATWIDADSHLPETIEAVRLAFGAGHDAVSGRVVGGVPDLVFIDGDHTYTGALVDVARYGMMLDPGCILALHDICGCSEIDPRCEAWRVWGELGPTWFDRREWLSDDTKPPAEQVLGCGIGSVIRR